MKNYCAARRPANGNLWLGVPRTAGRGVYNLVARTYFTTGVGIFFDIGDVDSAQTSRPIDAAVNRPKLGVSFYFRVRINNTVYRSRDI